MRNRRLERIVAVAASMIALGILGCESPAWVRTLNESFSARASEDSKAADEYRRQYVETRDRKALHWLLSHRIETGMSLGDVCLALGEDGVREENSNWVKTKGGNYQVVDVYFA
jgi:hypothetical protein